MWKIIGLLLCLALFVKLFELAAELLLAVFPYIMIAICAAALFWLIWKIAKHYRQKKKQIPADLKTLVRETGGSSASTKQALETFLGENRLVRSFHTRVVGVTYDNDDGSSRQEALSCCLRGEPVGFYWHDFRGSPACAVISDHGQIGYLSADLAEDLHYDYQDDRFSLVAHISDITGGYDGYSYGCNLLVSIYEEI